MSYLLRAASMVERIRFLDSLSFFDCTLLMVSVAAPLVSGGTKEEEEAVVPVVDIIFVLCDYCF